MHPRGTARATGLLAVLVSQALVAQQQGRPTEEIEVVGTTPLGGLLDADRHASNVQRATAEDIQRSTALDLADFMRRNLTGVFVNEVQNNPLQPDLQYRGFVGSPLLGLPQGIAVYQDAVRINEPFGDTVNWALIPESAIDTVYLMPGSNPLFGLNALGGALAIETKDGFSHPGTRAEAFAGSFSRIGMQAETGGSIDNRFGWFVTASRLEEDGWRDHSPTEATQLFGNLAWQTGRSRLQTSLTYADTDLIGNGAAPAQLLAIDREAIFTRPDQTRNELFLFNVEGEHAVSRRLTLTGNVYLRSSDVATYNGDDSDFEECEDTPGFICEEEDGEEELVFDENGALIPADDDIEGATVNRTSTEQDGAGFGLQASWSADVRGHPALFVAGLAYDESEIGFHASTELGTLDQSRLAVPGGVFIGDAFTRMNADTKNVGIFVSGTLSLSDRLSVTISGRFNENEVELKDLLGSALDGRHEFDRFNPAIGLTYALSDDVTFYAGYSESNRAPSPVELTCADEDDPCRLPNAFVADPPLEQVVAKTVEAGVRGGDDALRWHAGVFGTTNHDDILFISAGALTNQGFFDNVGRTRRIGVELDASGDLGDRASWFASYTWLEATFRSPLVVPSHHHPLAVDGEIAVERGDRLPLIPDRLLKAGVTVNVTPRFSIGADVLSSGSMHLRGDEGNLVDRVDSYTIASLRGEYALGDTTRIFGSIDNVFDTDYETFGVFGDPEEVLGDEFDDPRFFSPGAPRAAWIGIRVAF
ncbi:MAG TPA: TonB-dependent receptor [Gammaproteobacteria bacterium]